MKYLKTYNELTTEGLSFNKYGKIQNNITNELNVNFYFITTFGMTITALYPFFDTLVKTGDFGNISSANVVLLTICALAILFKESKDDINKMMMIIKEKNLVEILDKIIDTLENISKLFSNFSEKIGKTIIGIYDMFSYTALFIPFLVGLLDIINLYNLNFESFDQIMTNPIGTAISTSIGVLTISLKHIINFLLKKFKRNTKNKKTPSSDSVVQKFESVEKIYENYFNKY